MTVKRGGTVVLGIDHQGKGGQGGSKGTLRGIPEKSRAKLLAGEAPIDGQSAQASDGHGGVAWQLLRHGLGQIREHDTACRQSIEARDKDGIQRRSHVAGGHQSAHVLSCLLTKIPIEDRRGAFKGASVVLVG